MKLSYLVILSIVFTSCMGKNDKQLYGEAETAQGQQNFQVAIQHYQEIVEKFPTSAYAETSQYRIAVIYNNDMHDARKAIDAYRKFHTLFAKSNEAPNALFLIGFLYNNELHNIDSARIAYETFLQNYPNHSLASSAKFELETLGKDPTQLLQSRVVSKENEKTPESSNASKQ